MNGCLYHTAFPSKNIEEFDDRDNTLDTPRKLTIDPDLPLFNQEYLRLDAYQDALKEMQVFFQAYKDDISRLKGIKIDFIEQIENKVELVMNEYDLKEWSRRQYKLFGCLYYAARHMAFDVFTFTKIPADSNILLHHKKALALRKMSSSILDIILTSYKKHKKLENFLQENKISRLYAETFLEEMETCFRELMFLKDGAGKWKKVDVRDVISALKEHFSSRWKEALSYWTTGGQPIENIHEITLDLKKAINSRQFRESLREFNRMKFAYIVKGDYIGLIKNEMPSLYDIIYEEYYRKHKPLKTLSYVISADKKELKEFNNYYFGFIKLKLEDEYRDILSFGK